MTMTSTTSNRTCRKTHAHQLMRVGKVDPAFTSERINQMEILSATTKERQEAFPIGGPRKPVFDVLTARGFTESGWSDKWWKRADDLLAFVYGAGSHLLIRRASQVEILFDAPVAESLAFIDELDARAALEKAGGK